MLETSLGFAEAAKAPARQTTAAVILTLNSKAKPLSCMVEDNATTKEVPALVRGFISNHEITYIGPLCPPALVEPYIPWSSTTRSDDAGAFDTPPKITITYEQTHACRNILLIGNQHDLMREVIIDIWNGPTKALSMVHPISRARDGVYLDAAVMCTKIEITITGTVLPDRPASFYFVGSPSTLIVERDHFADLSVLEELGGGDLVPYSTVTANETDITLDNIDSIFTPSNKTSPLHGLMVPGLPIHVYMGVATQEDMFEIIPMGEFFTTEWSAPNGSAYSDITAHDLLYDLLDKELPLLRVVHAETIASLFRRIMTAMGIPDNKFRIEVKKTVPVTFGFAVGSNVGDALNAICEAGLCYITTDRLGRIVMRDYVLNAPVITMSDHDYIQTINNLERYNTIYSSLTVDIHEPILRRNDRMLDGYDIVAEPGKRILDDISFSSQPVLLLNSIALLDTNEVKMTDIDYGHDRVRVTIMNNHLENQKAKFQASATYVDSIIRARKTEGNTIGRSTMKITNPLVQTGEHADMLLNGLKNAISDPFSLFEFASRSNPAVEVGDVATLDAVSAKVFGEVVEIRRAEYRFDGGLECSYTARRVVYV